MAATVERAKLREVSEEGFETTDIIATRHPNTSATAAVWRVDSGLGFGIRTLSFDADGVLNTMVVEYPDMIVRRR